MTPSGAESDSSGITSPDSHPWETWEAPDPETKRFWLSEARERYGWEGHRRSEVYQGTDLLTIPRPDWLLAPVWQQRQLSVVAGPSNTFKTFLMVDVAMSLATGMAWDFMSQYHAERDPMPVMVVEGEGADTVAERVQGWLAFRGFDPQRLPPTLMVTKDLPNLWRDADTSGGSVDELLQRVAYDGVQMVVFDTLHATAAGANTNNPEDMNRIVGAMRRIRDESQAAVCVVHHYNKSGEIGGSNVLFAAMDTVLEVQPNLIRSRPFPGGPEEEEITGIWVKTTKQRRFPIKRLGMLHPHVVRYRDPWPDSITPEEDGTTLVMVRDPADQTLTAERFGGDRDAHLAARLLSIVRVRGPFGSKNALVKEAGVNRKAGYAAINTLLEQGEIFETLRGLSVTSEDPERL